MVAEGGETAFRKVAIRPAEGGRLVVDSFTADKHITREIAAEDLPAVLDIPFRRAHLQTTTGDLHARITRKGRILLSEGRPSLTTRPGGGHDRTRHHLLPGDRPHPLLQALDIQTPAGQVRSTRKGKFHQINQFLDILAALPEVRAGRGTLRVIDCGCGAAYLTFAAHHYLRDVRGLDVHTVGIDAKADLIARCEELRDRLGYSGLRFERARIADYAPVAAPHIVLSLHACDTATDEAIALGVRWRARAILAAPCCQHELRDRLRNEAMQAILRHGVLRGRMADLVTDAARAALLRTVGYTCDVIEFVSPEHTAKNLMLRAERRSSKPLPGSIDDYQTLKSAWQIAPTLERLLREAPQA